MIEIMVFHLVIFVSPSKPLSYFLSEPLQITLHGEMATSSCIKASGGTCVPGWDVPTHSKEGRIFSQCKGECCLSIAEFMSPRLRGRKWLLSSSHLKPIHSFWFLSMEFWILLLWLSIFPAKQCSLCGTARRLLTTWEWKLLSGHFSSTNHWTYLQTKSVLYITG